MSSYFVLNGVRYDIDQPAEAYWLKKDGDYLLALNIDKDSYTLAQGTDIKIEKRWDIMPYAAFYQLIQNMDFTDIANLIKSSDGYKEWLKDAQVKDVIKNKFLELKSKYDQETPDVKLHYERISYYIQGDTVDEWMEPTVKQKEMINQMLNKVNDFNRIFDDVRETIQFEENGWTYNLILEVDVEYISQGWIGSKKNRFYLENVKTGKKRSIIFVETNFPYHLGATTELPPMINLDK